MSIQTVTRNFRVQNCRHAQILWISERFSFRVIMKVQLCMCRCRLLFTCFFTKTTANKQLICTAPRGALLFLGCTRLWYARLPDGSHDMQQTQPPWAGRADYEQPPPPPPYFCNLDQTLRSVSPWCCYPLCKRNLWSKDVFGECF
jgi:hypothetical protein